jgi:hypothetical protein
MARAVSVITAGALVVVLYLASTAAGQKPVSGETRDASPQSVLVRILRLKNSNQLASPPSGQRADSLRVVRVKYIDPPARSAEATSDARHGAPSRLSMQRPNSRPPESQYEPATRHQSPPAVAPRGVLVKRVDPLSGQPKIKPNQPPVASRTNVDLVSHLTPRPVPTPDSCGPVLARITDLSPPATQISNYFKPVPLPKEKKPILPVSPREQHPEPAVLPTSVCQERESQPSTTVDLARSTATETQPATEIAPPLARLPESDPVREIDPPLAMAPEKYPATEIEPSLAMVPEAGATTEVALPLAMAQASEPLGASAPPLATDLASPPATEIDSLPEFDAAADTETTPEIAGDAGDPFDIENGIAFPAPAEGIADQQSLPMPASCSDCKQTSSAPAQCTAGKPSMGTGPFRNRRSSVGGCSACRAGAGGVGAGGAGAGGRGHRRLEGASGRCFCQMPQHMAYFPEMHGYYYHRPYTPSKLTEHRELAIQWGEDPRAPYGRQIFQQVYDDYLAEQQETPTELSPEELVELLSDPFEDEGREDRDQDGPSITPPGP